MVFSPNCRFASSLYIKPGVKSPLMGIYTHVTDLLDPRALGLTDNVVHFYGAYRQPIPEATPLGHSYKVELFFCLLSITSMNSFSHYATFFQFNPGMLTRAPTRSSGAAGTGAVWPWGCPGYGASTSTGCQGQGHLSCGGLAAARERHLLRMPQRSPGPGALT